MAEDKHCGHIQADPAQAGDSAVVEGLEPLFLRICSGSPVCSAFVLLQAPHPGLDPVHGSVSQDTGCAHNGSECPSDQPVHGLARVVPSVPAVQGGQEKRRTAWFQPCFCAGSPGEFPLFPHISLTRWDTPLHWRSGGVWPWMIFTLMVSMGHTTTTASATLAPQRHRSLRCCKAVPGLPASGC
ncbi:uncharacterized protein LOC144340074 [Macaca mulatta]